MKAWAFIVLCTFLPLTFLTIWTFTIKRGAGPQGGEFLALGWLSLFFWILISGFITTLLYGSTLKATNWVRYGAIPSMTLLVGVMVLGVLTTLLNHATLPELTVIRSRIEISLVALGTALLVGGQLVLIYRMPRLG